MRMQITCKKTRRKKFCIRIMQISWTNTWGLGTQNWSIHTDWITTETLKDLVTYIMLSIKVVTMKTRVVFNASAKTSNGISLNDTLMVRPTIQEDLFYIIIGFRMLSCVCYDNWRIKDLYTNSCCTVRLWTATYSVVQSSRQRDRTSSYNSHYSNASASFLATRCLQQITKENLSVFPLALEIIRRDFKVDNLLTGVDNLDRQFSLNMIWLVYFLNPDLLLPLVLK